MPGIKLARKLISDRKYRAEHNMFWVDGVAAVDKALSYKWEIESLIYVPAKINTDYKKQIVASVDKAKHMKVEEGEYAYLSVKNDIQGVGAIMKIQKTKNKLQAKTEQAVVLVSPRDPGNVGTIMRTMVGFGLHNLVVVGKSVDVFHPNCVRSSMGAMFGIKVFEIDSEELFITLSKDYKKMATSLSDKATKIYDFKSDVKPELIIFGNEATGLPKSLVDGCQHNVYIPISKEIDSLNLAEAVGIILYELVVVAGLRTR